MRNIICTHSNRCMNITLSNWKTKKMFLFRVVQNSKYFFFVFKSFIEEFIVLFDGVFVSIPLFLLSFTQNEFKLHTLFDVNAIVYIQSTLKIIIINSSFFFFFTDFVDVWLFHGYVKWSEFKICHCLVWNWSRKKKHTQNNKRLTTNWTTEIWRRKRKNYPRINWKTTECI